MFNPLCGHAVLRIRQALPDKPTVIEFGSQTLGFKIKDWPDVATVPGFYRQLGFEKYDAIDLDGNGTIKADLNGLVFQTHKEKYDLVTNNGTGEHIFDAAGIFVNAHEFCKVGGVMLHVLPWINWRNHGFYNFNPILFSDMAKANGYEILMIYAGDRDGNIIYQDVPGDEIKKPDATDKNIALVVALRKTKDDQFKAPMQGKYSHVVERRLESVVSASVVKQRIDAPFPCYAMKLGETYFNELKQNFPIPDDVVLGREVGSNILLQRGAKEVLADESTTRFWRSFFELHTSTAFLQEVVKLFGAEIHDNYPQLSRLDLKAGVRFRDSAPFLLDCQFAVNTPVKKAGTVRGPHIDDPKELFGGMVYMGGGALDLYKWKNERLFIGRKGMVKKAECAKGSVIKVASITCNPGTIVLFLNTPDSIHGVAPRKRGDGYRSYINLIGEIAEPLFALK